MRHTDPSGASPSADTPAVSRGHEPDVVNVRGILLFGFWLVVVAIVFQVGLWGLLRVFQWDARRRQPELATAVRASLRRTPAEPRLEALPVAPRVRLHAEEDSRLTSYGWINRPGGVARIPIDRAMELVVERGVPGGKPLPPNPTPPPLQAPGPVPASGQGVLR
jgi:hypothetical protein